MPTPPVPSAQPILAPTVPPRRAPTLAALAAPAASAICAPLAAFLLVALAGCGFTGATGDLRTSAADGTVSLAPRPRVVVYAAQDENTADVYLSDLEPADLESTASIATFTGSIIHIHLFLRPRAGRTPIEPTASTASIRHVVLAGGPVGVYGGGGFVSPDGQPGDGPFAASVSAGTLRLNHATQGFNDRLGAADISGSFRASQDPAMAALLASRIAEAIDIAR